MIYSLLQIISILKKNNYDDTVSYDGTDISEVNEAEQSVAWTCYG